MRFKKPGRARKAASALAMALALLPDARAGEPLRNAPMGDPAADDAFQAIADAMGSEVGAIDATPPDAATQAALAAAGALLAKEGVAIDRPQVALVVDRAANVQRLWVVLAEPGDAPWPVAGAVRVSTGKPGRKEHYKTPVGVFESTPAILGYRALGTRNGHGVRGIGAKGMRVWDFGWQTTEDWRTRGAVAAVRLEMHATDPALLEGRLGRPDSEACIRIPTAFNRFLDRHGLIDAQLHAAAPGNRAVAALLGQASTPSPVAGDKVLVVDTEEPAAQPSDTGAALAIEARFKAYLAGAGDDGGEAAPSAASHAPPSSPLAQPAAASGPG